MFKKENETEICFLFGYILLTEASIMSMTVYSKMKELAAQNRTATTKKQREEINRAMME